MPRKRAHEDPEATITLAPPVTAAQRAELAWLGYRGPSPSTSDQADAILRQRREPSVREEGRETIVNNINTCFKHEETPA